MQGKEVSTARQGWSSVVSCCHSAKIYLHPNFACQRKEIMKCSVTIYSPVNMKAEKFTLKLETV